MINKLVPFLISLMLHIGIVVSFFYIDFPKVEEKKLVVLDLNMINEVTKIQKTVEKKELLNTKKILKSEDKKVEKIVEKKVQQKVIKKETIKKTIEKKVLNKDIKKELETTKTIEDVVATKKNKEIQNKPLKNESEKRIRSDENYQQLYMKNNLAKIIAAIKKYKTYPYIARKRGIEGKSIINCIITKTGQVKEIKISDSSGFKILDVNSIEILKLASKEFTKPQKDIQISIPFNYYLN